MTKNSIIIGLFAALTLGLVINACQTQTEQQYETRWMGEDMQEILASIEEQFGGFSGTMVETGYRYAELYWAGKDQNWEYALYQIEHIEEAMEKGFIRRPARQSSARQFMQTALPEIEAKAEAGNKDAFMESFTRLTASCNTCHAMEDVEYMLVQPPQVRASVITF